MHPFQIKSLRLKSMQTVSGSARHMSSQAQDIFTPLDQFQSRHMGSQGSDKQKMLDKVGFATLADLVDSAVPKSIRLPKNLELDQAMSETEALAKLKGIMSQNKVLKSFIGMGYYEVLTPHVILRNVCELIFAVSCNTTSFNVCLHIKQLICRCWRTPDGTPRTLLTRRRSLRAVCSLF